MAGKHGSRSNYADKPSTTEYLDTEYRLRFGDEKRAYTPTAAEEGTGHFGGLAHGAAGDWSWKPQRYKADPGVCYKPGYAVDRTASLEAQMPTFRGVPKSAAEMHRGQVFARS